MNGILFLTRRMSQGFGVDVVVHSVSRHLIRGGHRVAVGAIEDEGWFTDLPIHELDPEPGQIAALANKVGAQTIVAHTGEFADALARMNGFARWFWNHGEPTAELFGADSEERARAAHHLKEVVYPQLDGVIAISEFIRHDIGWPDASVIHNGCDHAPSLGSKTFLDHNPARGRPLRVGTLMRLGAGESMYKGNALYNGLVASARAAGSDFSFEVMGRGTSADAKQFEKQGVRVHLNASESEKWNYLRELDVFVSCSLWEGCNLPVLEAQAMGTPALALDTGAHPEFTPHIMRSIPEMLAVLDAWSCNPSTLHQQALHAHRMVRSSFRWVDAATTFVEVLELSPSFDTLPPGSRRVGGGAFRAPALFRKAKHTYETEGFAATALKALKKVRDKLS